MRELVHIDHAELVDRVLDMTRSGHGGAGLADWKVIGAHASPVKVEVSCQDLRADSTVEGLVLTLSDVTEQRRLERELTHRANHDLRLRAGILVLGRTRRR